MATISHLYIPAEILNIIFSHLSPEEITTCRAVSQRWQSNIDSFAMTQPLWRIYCKKKFRQISESAYRKSSPELTWYHLYRSLTLWPKIQQAQDIENEFSVAESYQDEVLDFQLLQDGVTGVHTRKAIVYYNINTLQQIQKRNIPSDYTRYCENDDWIILSKKVNMSIYTSLNAISKVKTKCFAEVNIKINYLQAFLLLDKVFYYVTSINELYSCEVIAGNFTRTKVANIRNGVISLGYRNGRVYILTYCRSIFKLVGNTLKNVKCLHNNFLLELRRYNFFEQLDKRVFGYWMNIINKNVPGVWTDITLIRMYGHIILVGYSWGLLSIFHSPYYENMIDLLNSRPLKEYQLECCCQCEIRNIDVVEAEDGHKIFVAMTKKMLVININHCFNISNLESPLNDELAEINTLDIMN